MKDEELDQLLDEALESYAAGEPRPGIERRVLYRVESAGRSARIWWWSGAVAAFACVVVMALVWPSRPAEKTVAHAVISVKRAAATPESAQAAATVAARPAVRQVARHRLPKPERFPTPAPLTPEERVLMEFATRFPDQAKAAFTVSDKPISIPEIEIKPLDDGS